MDAGQVHLWGKGSAAKDCICLFLFMNQCDVLSVAKFVQQLQPLMDTSLGAPTDNPTNLSFLWLAIFFLPL
jgi:hypothetical protein